MVSPSSIGSISFAVLRGGATGRAYRHARNRVTHNGKLMSDSIAQATVKSSGWPDEMRMARFSIFGFMDGVMSHAWFGLLYAVLGDGVGLEGQDKVIDILLKQFM
jgi:hypothetical protein